MDEVSKKNVEELFLFGWWNFDPQRIICWEINP